MRHLLWHMLTSAALHPLNICALGGLQTFDALAVPSPARVRPIRNCHSI